MSPAEMTELRAIAARHAEHAAALGELVARLAGVLGVSCGIQIWSNAAALMAIGPDVAEMG